MGRLYIDRRYFARNDAKWVSFETNPGLKRTKSDIYGRCVPCITSLYEQLKEGRSEISLGRAHQCWKVVVPLADMEECTRFLSDFENDYLGDMDIKGRFGSADPTKGTKVIVFNAESETERDRLYDALTRCASRTSPGTEVLYHRACADLYHELLGDWRGWRETETIKNPAMVQPILERIRTTLFWQRKEVPGKEPASP